MDQNLTMNNSVADMSNSSTASVLDDQTTLYYSDTAQTMFDVSKYANGFIIILGLITNTLIIITLSGSRIGSVTTKIILLFLAVTDITVMLVLLFLHFIPHYTRWFPVFYEGTCGLAMVAQFVVLTAASWYITLMTIERFIVVWHPMKARLICTKKTITIICSCVPIVCFAIFAYHIPNWIIFDSNGYPVCNQKPGQHDVYKGFMQLWVILYFFIPAFVIVSLNIAIVVKLKSARTLQRKLTQRKSYHQVPTSVSYGSALNSSQKDNGSRTGSRKTSKRKTVSGIRKATILVIVASVTFVVLMIPRGVTSVILALASKPDRMYRGDAGFISDHIAFLLQQLNHATNFFIYALANAAFRKQLIKIFSCKKLTTSQSRPTTMQITVDTATNGTRLNMIGNRQLSGTSLVDQEKTAV